jgi:hypothetical protein
MKSIDKGLAMSNSRQPFKPGQYATANLKEKVRLFDLYAFNIESVIERMLLALKDPESDNENNVLATEEQAKAQASYIEKSILQCLNQDLLKFLDLEALEQTQARPFISTIAKYVAKNPSSDPKTIKTKLQNDAYEELEKLDLKQENFSLNNTFLCRQYGLSERDMTLLRALTPNKTPQTVSTSPKADNADTKTKGGSEAGMIALLDKIKAIRLLKHAVYVIPGIYEDKHPKTDWSFRIGSLFHLTSQAHDRTNSLRALAKEIMNVPCLTQDPKTAQISPSLNASDVIANHLLMAYKTWHSIQTSKDISKKMSNISDHHQARMLAILLAELHASNLISAEMKKDIFKTVAVEEIQEINAANPTLYPALQNILNEIKELLKPAQPAVTVTPAATTAAAARK